MRLLTLALLVGACGNKPPAGPDPDAFKAMTPDQKCEATAPRGTQCVEEVMTMQVRQLSHASGGDNELADTVDAELKRTPRASGGEALTIHRTNCRGDNKYADAVFACWAEPTCDALVSCMDNRTR